MMPKAVFTLAKFSAIIKGVNGCHSNTHTVTTVLAVATLGDATQIEILITCLEFKVSKTST
jgi:hypothetical protein